MSEYRAEIRWNNDGSHFTDRKYSREHHWRFDGGTVVHASASPQVVPLPMSSESAVDPEEAFVAALASCHMLFFLDFAARAGIGVEAYTDRAVGTMGKDEKGRTVMTRVSLNPQVEYRGSVPERSLVENLHHRAHEACFLANSVRTGIEVNPGCRVG